MPRALVVAVLSGAATAVLTVAAASLLRCIDSPVFYHPPAVAWAAIGVAAIAAGAMLSTSRRIGIVMAVIGIACVSFALIGPPYRTCGQFFLPT